MRFVRLVGLLACLGFALAAPTAAAAQYRTITCEATSSQRHECRVPGLDRSSVTMEEKLSESACISGSSWGTTSDAIWVSKGCRARFGYVARGGAAASGGGGKGTYQTITCEATSSQRHECRVPGLDRSSVTMEEKLSEAACVSGGSWGTATDAIWVSRGCRARFGYVARVEQSYGGGNRGSYRTVTCESRGDQRQQCAAPGMDMSSVTLDQKLSEAPCIQGSSWGTAGGEAIWVSKGCRGKFGYVTVGGSPTKYSGGTGSHSVECNSYNREWVHCDVADVRNADVTIASSNGQCNDSRAWGVDDTGIWVRTDCRATFRVRYRN